MPSYMVPPASEKIATLLSEVPMYRPTESADPASLMMVQFGLVTPDEAVAGGVLERAVIDAGTTGIVIEECAGECPHFLETGRPCAYVVKVTTLGQWHGQEIVVQGDEVTVTVADEAVWSPEDDEAVSYFLASWDPDADGGDDDYRD